MKTQCTSQSPVNNHSLARCPPVFFYNGWNFSSASGRGRSEGTSATSGHKTHGTLPEGATHRRVGRDTPRAHLLQLSRHGPGADGLTRCACTASLQGSPERSELNTRRQRVQSTASSTHAGSESRAQRAQHTQHTQATSPERSEVTHKQAASPERSELNTRRQRPSPARPTHAAPFRAATALAA